MYPSTKFALKIRVASPLGSPPLKLRAAASAAPSTALLNWAFTTYDLPLSTARPVKSSTPVRIAAMYTKAKPSCFERSDPCLFILLASSDISSARPVSEIRNRIECFRQRDPEPVKRRNQRVVREDLGDVNEAARAHQIGRQI